jgi:hypothetical protein
VQVPVLTMTAGPAPSPSSSQSPTTPSSSSLSTGANIGISLGTILGVQLVAALGIYFFCARKRRGASVQTLQPDGVNQGQYLPEMYDQDREHAARELFTGGQWKLEADASQKAGEVQDASNHTRAAPVELEVRRLV